MLFTDVGIEKLAEALDLPLTKEARLKHLEKGVASITKSMKGMTRGTEEWVSAEKKLNVQKKKLGCRPPSNPTPQ